MIFGQKTLIPYNPGIKIFSKNKNVTFLTLLIINFCQKRGLAHRSTRRDGYRWSAQNEVYEWLISICWYSNSFSCDNIALILPNANAKFVILSGSING